MPLQRKNSAKIPIETVGRRKLTSYGGLVLAESLLRRWRFWDLVNEAHFQVPHFSRPLLRPAQSVIGQIVYALVSGATNLHDAGLLQWEELLQRLLELERLCDDGELHAWLECQNKASFSSLKALNQAIIKAALDEFEPGGRETPVTLETFSTGKKGYIQWMVLTVGGLLLDADLLCELSDENVRKMIESNKSFVGSRKHTFHTKMVRWRDVGNALGLDRWSVEVSYYEVQGLFGDDPQNWPTGHVDDSAPGCQLRFLFPPPKRLSGMIAFQVGQNFEQQTFLLLPSDKSIDRRELFLTHCAAFSDSNELRDYLEMSDFGLEGPSAKAFQCLQVISYNLLAALRRAFHREGQPLTTDEAIRNLIIIPARESYTGGERSVTLGIPDEWPESWKKNLADAAHQMLQR